MPRPDDQAVQVPGAPQPDTAATDQAQATTSTEAGAPESDELAALRAQLAAKDAEIAALQAQAETAPKVTDGTVFEPVTRHGAVALAESEFRSLTTSQVHDKLKAGEITLAGKPSVLCADGYYCDTNYR